MDAVELSPVIDADFDRLAEWLRREHVRRWWGNPNENLEQLKAWSPEDLALVVLNGSKVGCVCWSHPTQAELDDAGLKDIPTAVFDIDIMIGEPSVLAQGVGTRALRIALKNIFSNPQDVPAVMAGTSVNNIRSVRALMRAGFWIERTFHDPIGGPFLLMWTDRPDHNCPFRNIRAAGVDDSSGLLPLMQEFNREEALEWDSTRTESALKRLLTHPDLGYVLVVEDGGLIGYAVVTYNFDLEFGGREAFITEIFVDFSVRERGIAAALLHAVEFRAREEKVRALHLQVRPENCTAACLYERFGYDLVPRNTMSKLLPAD